MHTRALQTALLATLALWLLAGCGSDVPDTVDQPNIILISTEATRPDHLSAYGYDRPTSTFMDSLAAEGVLFDSAYSVSSWTVPSVASLVTGTYPAAHKVQHGVVQDAGSRTIQGQEMLSPELPHLARILKAAGYKTFGITANGHLSKPLGYGEGFDFYRNLDFKAGSRLDAVSVNEIISNWKGQIKRGQPYFLWIHYFDPHDAYHARKPWIQEYFPLFAPHRQNFNKLTRATPPTLSEMGLEPGSPEHECLEALYDSEINFANWAMEDILHQLKVGPNALIVLTSDHGEEFLDHGGFGHASTLYEEQIRVPLVVRLPGARKKSVVQSTPVSLVDIAPTILDYLHLEIPDQMQGTSLMSLMNGRPRQVHEAIWTTVDQYAKMSAVRVGDWKLIVDHGEGDKPFLFNLVDDPAEVKNLAEDHPDRVAELLETMKGMEKTYGSDREALLNTEGLSEAEIEKLRSMGYVR